MEGRVDKEQINVAGTLVEISRRDRDALLQELAMIEGSRPLRLKFEAAGEHGPVELDLDERAQLRALLQGWEVPPPGIAPLLAALGVEPGGGTPGYG